MLGANLLEHVSPECGVEEGWLGGAALSWLTSGQLRCLHSQSIQIKQHGLPAHVRAAGRARARPLRPAIGLHKLLVANASKQRRRPRGKCVIEQFKFSPTNEIERHERQVFILYQNNLNISSVALQKNFPHATAQNFSTTIFFLRFACKCRVQSFSNISF
jgi:hypothetical protein